MVHYINIMKLLILVNSHPNNINDITLCKSRSHFLALQLKNNLIGRKDIEEVFIEKCYPFSEIPEYNLIKSKYNGLSINVFPMVDHIIFIDDYGFYDKIPKFMQYLRQYTKYSISTLLKSNRFYRGEDIIFEYIPQNNYLQENVLSCNPPLDEKFYYPDKHNKLIYILSQIPESFYDEDILYNKYNKKIKKYHFHNNDTIKFGLINTKKLNIVDDQNNIIESYEFETYFDYIKELRKCDVYLVTGPCDDYYRLYELSFCNSIILTKNNYIPNNIIKKLGIYVYDNEFEPKEILNNLDKHNIREKLLSDTNNWNLFSDKIINTLFNYQENKKNEPNDIHELENEYNMVPYVKPRKYINNLLQENIY